LIFDMKYFAGTNLDFVVSTHVETLDSAIGLAIRVTGTWNKKKNDLVQASMKTVGSYIVEVDDAANSNELFAGKLKISGPMVSDTSVPIPPPPGP